MVGSNQSRQFNITLSEYEYYLLSLWAENHNKTPAAYAAQIISARLESNYGWTPDEWNKRMNEWYAANNQ